MRLNPDCINSISDNKIDISSAWAWVDVLAYSPRYTETFNQPISMEATTLDFCRFKEAICTITIRETSDPTSKILWTGISYNIDDDGNTINGGSTPDTINYSTGVVGDTAPNAVYGSGTITIGDTYVNLCSDAFFETPIRTYWVNGGTFTLTDGIEQYLVIDYNGGTPIYRIENNKLAVNISSIILVRICWRQGTNVHSIDSDCQGLGLANKIESAIINTTPYRKSTDGGLVLSESATPTARTVLVSGAVVYSASTPHAIGAFNSSINQLTFVRHVAGVWTYSDVAVYNNSQYDNGTNLVSLGTNKYTVNWIYRSIGTSVQAFFVLGNQQYNTIEAAKTASQINVPLLLRDHCMLVGRIIVQNGATSGLVENVQDTAFVASAPVNHNDLANLQGAGPEYYHLSGTQYTDLTDAGDSALHYHSTDRNRAYHTGTQLASTISDFDNSVKTYGDSKYPQLSIQYTNPTWLAGIDASTVKSGTFDLARIPALPSANTIVCSTIPAMSAPDQALVGKGTVVIESSTGNTYRYSGSGSVILNASYIKQSDLTPDWATITNRPTNISYWSNDAGYLTALSSLDPAKITQTASYRFVTDTEKATWNAKQAGSSVLTSIATLSTGTGLLKLTNGSASLDTSSYATTTQLGNYVSLTGSYANPTWITSLDPAKITQTASYRFVTDTEKATWNSKQAAITTGTTSQYFRGDLSLATFPTAVSAFTNDSGYLTSTGTINNVLVTQNNTSNTLFPLVWDNGSNQLFHTAEKFKINPYTGAVYLPTLYLTTACRVESPTAKNDTVGAGAYYGVYDTTAYAHFWQMLANGNLALFSTTNKGASYIKPLTVDPSTGDIYTKRWVYSNAGGNTVPSFIGDWNSPYTWGICGGNGALNDNTIAFRTLDANHTPNGYANIAAGKGAFNGAAMPAWGTGLNPIMLGGEAFLYSYKTAYGTQPTWGSNFYYDGTNLKTIATYTNSDYPRALLLDISGTFHFFTSVTPPTAGATITDLSSKFSVDKTGVGTFAGSVTSKIAGIDVNGWTSAGYATFGCNNAIDTTKVCLMQNNTTFNTQLNGLYVVNLTIGNTTKMFITATETNIQNDLTFYPGQGRLACGNAVTEEHSGDGGSSLASAKILTLNKCCVISPASNSIYWYIPSATIIGQRIDLILKGTGGGPVGARVYANTSGSAIISYNGANVAFVGASTVSTYISLIWDGIYWVSCK